MNAGDVLIVSDANVLPTTANPLQGWLTANRGDHVVIPHARVALQSIPRMQSAPPRYCISTGTVTRPSYTPRAAGRKALFHHTYGALLLEFDVDGEVFPRHLLADDEGDFQDLNIKVANGVVDAGHAVAGIAWAMSIGDSSRPPSQGQAGVMISEPVATCRATTRSSIRSILAPSSFTT